jgi:S1-C subfamily serine protease
MTFSHKGFDEIRRLGLKRDTEKLIREASPTAETGMLVVESLVPGGPAHKLLEPGDVLLRANGEVVTQFLSFEILLDDNVGEFRSIYRFRICTPSHQVYSWK